MLLKIWEQKAVLDLRKRTLSAAYSEGPSAAFFLTWNVFFPVEISILVDPKQILVVSKNKKVKSKKKKKKI